MKKLILISALVSLTCFIFSLSIEEQIKKEKYHLVENLNKKKTRFVNWGTLFYYASFSKMIKIEKKDNFVQKALFEKRALAKRARKEMFLDILKININNEMTIKELIEINNTFQGSLTKLFFSPELLLPPVQAGYVLNLNGFCPFVGRHSLIDLIIKSGFFVDKTRLKPVESRYKPYPYHLLVIEARHLDFSPSLFPQIYTYDKHGEKKLIYSIASSDKEKIIDNGYVRYYRNLNKFNLNNPKIYYCPAMQVEGTKRTDLLISREDYIKFFGSHLSLKKLSEGALYIVAKVKRK